MTLLKQLLKMVLLPLFSERDVEGHPYILVDDCLEAFQALASYYLEKQRVDVIAVTGSNGKTQPGHDCCCTFNRI